MDDRSCEKLAQLLAQIWSIHRSPVFVEYLLQSFGCEPLAPVRFAGIFCLEMIEGYFFPDLPAAPGPIIQRLWLTDDLGCRRSSIEELRLLEHLESDNSLVVYDPSYASYAHVQPKSSLLLYPQIRFSVHDNTIIYHEQYANRAISKKKGTLAVGDQMKIEDVQITWTIWQGRGKAITLP